MDFTIDPDTVAIAEAVLRFVEREVLPLQQRRQLFAHQSLNFLVN